MAYTFEAFCADCKRILKDDPGPAGQEQVRVHLEKLLQDPEFEASHWAPDAETGRETTYEDPELGFHILSYNMGQTYKSPPHDHGASWAVYGQAREYTIMEEYRRVDDGSSDDHAELEKTKEYRLDPGHAGIFNAGIIHTIDYPPGARFVRVTGTDLDKIDRLKFDLETKKAEQMGPAPDMR